MVSPGIERAQCTMVMLYRIACGIFLLLCLLLPVSLKRWTHSVHLSRCQLTCCRDSLTIPSLISCEERDQLLADRYVYLGRGAQCFVFGHETKEVVLKLYFFDGSVPTLWQKFWQRIRCFRSGGARAFQELQEACRLASLYVLKDTGLLYAHLNLQEKLPITELIGPTKRKMRVHLDSFCFVLQRKTEPLVSVFAKCKEKGETEEHEKYIQQLAQLQQHRRSLGIQNRDESMSNYGVYQGEVMEIDFGKYTLKALNLSH